MRESKDNFMEKVALFIVDKRKAFYLIFAIAFIFCAVSIPKVKVVNDIASYLPESTETKQGLDLMDREFVTCDTFSLMITNISYELASKMPDRIKEVEGVKEVEFDDSADHFNNSSALFTVTLNAGLDTEEEIRIENEVKEKFSDYDCYTYSSSIDNSSDTLQTEMSQIVVVVAIIIIAILLFTSKSYMDVLVFLIVFIVAAVLNMGSNYLLGEISFISNSVAIVLQLALAIDYAIIMSHRFAEEKERLDSHDAIVKALSKAIIEISSSSLTTIAGLAALMTMQLRIGLDLGLVLCKGILCSLLTVFLLMPGLLLMFSKLIDKTVHKNHVPDISFWGRIVIKTKNVVPIIFAVVMVAGIVLSSMCDYAFDQNTVQSSKLSEDMIAKNKIKDNFEVTDQLVVIVPKGEYEKEKKILQDVSEFDGIASALGLANVEVNDEFCLTDKVTPRQFAELMDIDISTSRTLFQAYGASVSQYSAIFQDADSYTVPIIDILMFVHEQMDFGVIDLGDEMNDEVNDLYEQVTDAREQLEGEEYSRMVFTYRGGNESPEVVELHDNVREKAKKYYDSPMLVSNAISAMDLGNTFSTDNMKISMLTLLAVLLILVITFKSSSVPVLLVLTIQGSIWINFSFPYLMNKPLYFLGYLVVSSIQMGATIDYAIVFTNRYLELKPAVGKKRAAIESLNAAFPTILTSGLIMMIAGFLIGFISTNPVINSLGTCLGRGTLISILLVMTVLPQILILFDKLVEKGAFTIKVREKSNSTGLVYVDGRVKGYVCGYVNGTIHGVIKGDVKAVVENMTDKPNEIAGKLQESKPVSGIVPEVKASGKPVSEVNS
ncbi:MAG: MMPL family transporter [Clostridiales bacterium]|nr:MMPL family transporter [Clostridiales bacterium]